MPLSKEEKEQLEALQRKAEEPDEEPRGGAQRIENVNYTINLEDDVQVRRAVRAGLLPASYLEDDDDGEEPDDDGKTAPDDAPRRRLDGRYS